MLPILYRISPRNGDSFTIVVRVAGLEPARAHHPRDFKSLASTISPNPRERDFTTPWEREEAPKTKKRPAHCQALPASPSIREWSPA